MLEFRGVNTYYGELHVLKDVNYKIDKGEIVCLLGGNASGKSTTMKIVLGLVKPQSGVVRSDIRPSFGSAGTAIVAGTPATITLQLVNTSDNCAPLAGYAIYVWHCNAAGQYSLYSPGATTQNYLRGVQITDDEGKVTFTSTSSGPGEGLGASSNQMPGSALDLTRAFIARSPIPAPRR